MTSQTASAPVRIQRHRTKGWRKPAGAVIVDRTSRWGNPFPVGREGPLGRIAPDNAGAVGLYRAMLADPEMRAAAGYPSDAEIIAALRGRDLCCPCALDLPCHATTLLEIANAP